MRPRKIDFRTITSVGAKNYGFVSSDARAVSVRKDTFTGRKRARLSVKVAATIYVGEWSRPYRSRDLLRSLFAYGGLNGEA